MDDWHSSSADELPAPLHQIPTEPNLLSRRPGLAHGVPALGLSTAVSGYWQTPEISGDITEPVSHFDNGATRQYRAVIRNFDRHRALEEFNRPSRCAVRWVTVSSIERWNCSKLSCTASNTCVIPVPTLSKSPRTS